MTKKQVVAIGTIVRAMQAGVAGNKLAGIPPQPPKVERIIPGTTFLADHEDREAFNGKTEYEHLKGVGVIRDYVGSARTFEDLAESAVKPVTSTSPEADARAAAERAAAAKVKEDAEIAARDAQLQADEEARKLVEAEAAAKKLKADQEADAKKSDVPADAGQADKTNSAASAARAAKRKADAEKAAAKKAADAGEDDDKDVV